jgi:putative ABC transport system permease protein
VIPVRYSVRNLGQRITTSAMTAVSVALVIMVLTILLGFVNGMRRTVTLAAERGNAMILQRGVPAEAGYVNHQTYDIIRFRPEIALDAAGRPLLSPEYVLSFDPTPDAPRASTARIREVTPMAFEVHPGVKIIEGRKPERGKEEWIVGQRLAAQYPKLRVGSVFRWGRVKVDWKIVGKFSDHGSARESEVWADLESLTASMHLTPGQVGYNSIHLVLKPGYRDSFANALRADSRLQVDLWSESDFYQQAAGFATQIRTLGLIVAMILAIGACFGAMNTMYSAVARRRREVGTMRVLGFGRSDVLSAFVVESAVLGLIGGAIGELLAVIVAHTTGLASNIMSVGNILFSFSLPWDAFGYGLVAAVIIGVIGGLLPAWQAAHLDVMDALRE